MTLVCLLENKKGRLLPEWECNEPNQLPRRTRCTGKNFHYG